MPPNQSKTQLYAAIRRDSRAGRSGQELQAKYNVGYRTVNAALTSAFPEARKEYPARAAKLDPYKSFINEMLRTDLDAPRKQRHTIKRIYARLIDEHGMDDVSYRRVRDYVEKRKPQIRVEAGREPPQVFIPQTYRPDAEAEVDFGEVTVELRGERTVLYLFSLRMSYSGRSVQRNRALTSSLSVNYDTTPMSRTQAGTGKRYTLWPHPIPPTRTSPSFAVSPSTTRSNSARC